MSSPSEVVDEYLDRERRKHNLIIYNLQEPKNVHTNTERSRSDIGTLARLFHSQLGIQEDVEITKCIRLGKVDQNKARPVLITIPDGSKRSLILRNASSLRKTEHHKHTYISPDMTPKKREIGKKLRSEIKRHKSQGETNITIRHGKIVTINSHPTSNTCTAPVNAHSGASSNTQQN